MSDISGHNDSSILREFSSQYEDICSQNKDQAGIIEALQQEVHSLKNRLQVAEKIQLDYQSELDCQQQQINDANDLASIAALKLKEDHAIIVKGLEDKVHSLESELQEVTNALAATKDELLKAKKEIKDCQDESPVASLKTQLQELMEEHAANRLACVQHLELNQVLLKEKAYLVDELNATREHLEITGEKLKICKEDMLQQSETLEDLRESLAVAQNELTCLQSGPPPEKQGNSLFAEVEDKRQAILARNKVLSKRYIEMKMDYGSKCDEISKLKMENLKLRQKWRDEAEERDNRDVWLKDNYEIRIQELYKLVEDLRREEKPVFVNGNAQILAYADQYVDEKKKEIVKLREEMELRSATRLNEAKALYLARSKVQALNAEVMLLNAENLVLRDKLNEANITDIPSPGKTVKRIKEVWGSVTEAKSCSPLEETLKSCSYVDETSCNSVSKTPEPSSSEAPTACEETNTTQSQSEEPSCPPPISSNQTSISSIIRSIPKPQRLLRIERMEKLNAVSNDEEKSQPESATCGISLDGSDVQLEDVSLINPDRQEMFVTFPKESDPETDENAQHNEPIDASPSHLDHIQEPIENSCVVEDKENEAPTFKSSFVMKPASSLQEEKHTDGVCSEETLHPSDFKDDEPSIQIIKQACEVSNESWIEPAIETKRQPRQSILTKPSGLSLMPIDQNVTRKVRFADPSNKEEESQTSDQKTTFKHKLPRAPKPYKTRYIVSKELD